MDVARSQTGEEVQREGLPAEDVAHPGPRQYVTVAVVLAVVTAAEVALYYLEFIPQGVMIGLLMVLMVIKFALVALWFMHLRFDSPIYKRLFITGIILAFSVFSIVLLTFGVLVG
ncbi:MAG TPA: cytochrome C oxidase subunit IV family protein [Actinomycetota bacterium]|nr:cytochrome C oxidase subunit IV family protein [Actinomycetota bacterium]